MTGHDEGTWITAPQAGIRDFAVMLWRSRKDVDGRPTPAMTVFGLAAGQPPGGVV